MKKKQTATQIESKKTLLQGLITECEETISSIKNKTIAISRDNARIKILTKRSMGYKKCLQTLS